jgi:CDP-paratose 2-epimerase
VTLAGRHEDWEILALDNLKRRGSELNLPRLREAGVGFLHGDVRSAADLAVPGELDAIVECSAEPSVLAGRESADYTVQTNLIGAYRCLELAREKDAQFVFLSTSRVYPVEHLESVRWEEADTRFEIASDQQVPGASPAGISEGFPLDGARTMYGATKLAGELLIAEYADAFGLSAVIDRCGVLAGPWQMGKVDQGVFAHWMLYHYFRLPLRYIGYGGTGKQVRDLLHIDDLIDLVDGQLLQPERWAGRTFNVGGGREVSLSLLETTALCRELTGHEVEIEPELEPRPGDVPIYVSDCSAIEAHSGWRPARGPRDILGDLLDWIRANERAVKTALLKA